MLLTKYFAIAMMSGYFRPIRSEFTDMKVLHIVVLVLVVGRRLHVEMGTVCEPTSKLPSLSADSDVTCCLIAFSWILNICTCLL